MWVCATTTRSSISPRRSWLSPILTWGRRTPLVGAMLSQRQVASEFSAALNRRVEYVEIKFEQFREALTRQTPDNPVAVTHLSILWGQVL